MTYFLVETALSALVIGNSALLFKRLGTNAAVLLAHSRRGRANRATRNRG
jgi:hypothetical protein